MTAAALKERITGEWQRELDEVADDLRSAGWDRTGPGRRRARLAGSLAHLAFACRFSGEACASGEGNTRAQALARAVIVALPVQNEDGIARIREREADVKGV